MGPEMSQASNLRHVSVLIDGKQFRMACEEGEEPHLHALAAHLDAKIQQMRQSFGEIGDQRLTVMAALMICDEFFEERRRSAAFEDKAGVVDAAQAATADDLVRREAEIAAMIDQVSSRVERITEVLAGQRLD
jgi:cell division protein ZapA